MPAREPAIDVRPFSRLLPRRDFCWRGDRTHLRLVLSWLLPNFLRASSQLGLAAALLAAFSLWCYADFILIPHQQAESERLGIPRGNLSDLYPRWLGTRELLLHGRDPYSPDVTREIQAGYYGRVLDPGRANDPKDQQGFAYPIYVAFLLAPTVTLPFALVQAAFRWLLIAITALTVPLWFRAVGWRASWPTKATWIILALGSFAAVQGIKLQQLTLLVCGLTAAAMVALIGGRLLLAGVLLGLSTIKPQLVGILILWLALWTVVDWRSRRRLAYGFLATMFLLVVGGELLLPGWISRFHSAASAYMQYTGGGKSVLDVLLGAAAGKIAALLIILGTAIFCWRNRQAQSHDPKFAWSLALVLGTTLAVAPTYAPYNQLLLLPALMMIAREMPRLWRSGRFLRAMIFLTSLAVAWSWLSSVLLTLSLPFISRPVLQSAWTMPLAANFFVPLTVLALSALCAWKVEEQPPQSIPPMGA